jgi:hypothetical protein
MTPSSSIGDAEAGTTRKGKGEMDDPIEKLVLPLWPDTGKALGLSRNATYDAARRGDIPTVPFGKLKKVPAWFFRQLRDGAPKAP